VTVRERDVAGNSLHEFETIRTPFPCYKASQ
jgi:hypothetical protein